MDQITIGGGRRICPSNGSESELYSGSWPEKSRFAAAQGRMAASDNPTWFLDCPLIDDIPDAGGDFAANKGGFYWAPQGVDLASGARYSVRSLGGSFVLLMDRSLRL